MFSQYVTPRLKDATRGEALMLRGFLVAAGIPFDCALSNKDFDRATLIERIGRF